MLDVSSIMHLIDFFVDVYVIVTILHDDPGQAQVDAEDNSMTEWIEYYYGGSI